MRRLLLIALLVVAACTDQSGTGGPDLTSVGFGTGGDRCTLEGSASTFPAGVTIRTVLTVEPALPAGSTITVTVEKDGVVLEDPQTITMSEPAPCMFGTLPDLEAGHYRMTYRISPSSMPPVTGEFEVTPAESSLAPAGSSPEAPSPASDGPFAKHIIGRLDELAGLAAKENELLTANWAIDESQWATENMADLIDRGGTLSRYVDELMALVDIVAAGAESDPCHQPTPRLAR